MKKEFRAVQIAIACSIVGAITKFIVGITSHSMSMISSAVDSLGDLLVSVVNLWVLKLADTSADENHNYGHTKVEGLGAMFEGGFIFSAGIFIIYESVHKLLIGEATHDSMLGIIVMLPLLALTGSVVVYLRRVAKETGSLVIKSDALHYMTDVWVNLGVLVSLVLVKLTGKPIIDSVISIMIALYMLYSSTHIVREGLAIILDESLTSEVVKQLKELLDGYGKILSYHDFKTRRGRISHVDFHIVVPPEMTTKEVHDIFLDLQQKIRSISGTSTKVLMHADPAVSGSVPTRALPSQ